METGTVKFFNNTSDKLFGFIETEDGDVFFHFNNGPDGNTRMPRKGDRLAFEVKPSPRGPKATAWVFEEKATIRINPKKPAIINWKAIREIGEKDLQAGDLSVEYIDDAGMGGFGCGPRISWVEIIFRPSSNELFRIDCWDGENGGCSPDLPRAPLPAGITIVK